MVLFIGGMLLVGVIQLATGLTENAKQKTTRENMQAVKLALQNFVGRTGRLPCPAVHTDAEAAATFGVEAPNPGTCTGTVDLESGLARFGTLPWKTLGLSATSALDGSYNQFSYAVTRTATSTNLTTAGVMRGTLTVHTAAPTTNGLPATGNQINSCSTTAGDNSCNLLASVIIISHGRNGLGAYTGAGTAVGSLPTSAYELKNTIISTAPSTLKTDVAFVNAAYSEGTSTYFDDIVMALTPADVLAPLLAQGGVKYESVLLAEKFRQLVVSLTAYGVEFRSGTPGIYQYPLPPTTGLTVNLAFINAGNFAAGTCDAPFSSSASPITAPIGLSSYTDMQLIKDPWGNNFYYQRATANANATESCPTFAVFVSAGPDGNFATTADNSVYYVTKGEYDAIIANVGW